MGSVPGSPAWRVKSLLALDALAAKRAGIWCAVVPTPMTATQDFAHADFVVPTLAGLNLAQLIARCTSSVRV